ncbi:MAG: permease [Halioglobus sp.]
MSECHRDEPTPVLASAGPDSACCAQPAEAEDSCCTEPARRDYFFWVCVAIVALAYVFGAMQPEHEHESVLSVFTGGIFELFNLMWWGIALGIFFVGLLARVPRELVMGILGRKTGLGGLFRATCAGVLLDLCSHGILAVGMKLYERGASIGQVMAFLLASPWNSISLTLILLGLIGVGWTLMFILLSLVIGIITGLIFDRLVVSGTLPDNPWRATLGEEQPLGLMWREFRASMKLSLGGTGALIKDGIEGSRVVIRWTFFGLILAALIRALVPEDAFATWFGASFLGLWLTLLAATVIEVCSEGATPIAADLMNRAGAPGNSFTFLMAGVATDYTEIMSIRDTTKSWKIALFLPLIAVPQVMVIGFILNGL